YQRSRSLVPAPNKIPSQPRNPLDTPPKPLTTRPCLKTLRERRPDDRLYVVLDNFSPHKHAQVTAWAAADDVDLVFTPTYTSWLNWIVRHEVACDEWNSSKEGRLMSTM
ncbi:MAG: family transposase, partial [Gemmatimonadales bacterium]|nr:family transposase [Gemmatimonadales bacterium]